MTHDLYLGDVIASDYELEDAKKHGELIILGSDEYVREVYKRIELRRHSRTLGLEGQPIDDLIDKLRVHGKFGSEKTVCRPLSRGVSKGGFYDIPQEKSNS